MQIQSLIDMNVPMDANRVAAATRAWLEEQDQAHLLFDNGGVFKAGPTWCRETAERNESKAPQVYNPGGQAA
jgi:hypothetical protein